MMVKLRMNLFVMFARVKKKKIVGLAVFKSQRELKTSKVCTLSLWCIDFSQPMCRLSTFRSWIIPRKCLLPIPAGEGSIECRDRALYYRSTRKYGKFYVFFMFTQPSFTARETRMLASVFIIKIEGTPSYQPYNVKALNHLGTSITRRSRFKLIAEISTRTTETSRVMKFQSEKSLVIFLSGEPLLRYLRIKYAANPPRCYGKEGGASTATARSYDAPDWLVLISQYLRNSKS